MRSQRSSAFRWKHCLKTCKMIKMPLAAKILDGVLFSFSVMPKHGGLGRTDSAQKSSAEPREAYKRTLSGETTIENENSIDSTLIFFKYTEKKRKRHKSIPLPFCLRYVFWQTIFAQGFSSATRSNRNLLREGAIGKDCQKAEAPWGKQIPWRNRRLTTDSRTRVRRGRKRR